jgi:uncharacterized membrane protein
MNPAEGDAVPQPETALAPIEPVTIVNPPRPIGQPQNSGNGRLIAASKTVHFSGPMPHPELLGQYEQLCPGSADRIIRMAEQEAEHRRSAEHKIIDAQIKDRSKQYSESRCGQLCALVITLAALGVGAYTAVLGHEIAGSIIGVGGIGGIVTTFILGQTSRAAGDPPKPEEPPKPRSSRRRKK